MDPSTHVDLITRRIIAAAIAVHRAIGPGLLESAYQACLAAELAEQDLQFEQQVDLPIIYRGRKLECGYRMVLSSKSWWWSRSKQSKALNRCIKRSFSRT